MTLHTYDWLIVYEVRTLFYNYVLIFWCNYYAIYEKIVGIPVPSTYSLRFKTIKSTLPKSVYHCQDLLGRGWWNTFYTQSVVHRLRETYIMNEIPNLITSVIICCSTSECKISHHTRRNDERLRSSWPRCTRSRSSIILWSAPKYRQFSIERNGIKNGYR